MKKLGMIVSVVSILVVGLNADTKRYDIESGKIEYTSTTSGNMMGITTTGKGTETLFFKDYGNLEISEENSSTTTMGQTQKLHKMTKIEKGKVYSVDFDHQKILTMDNPMMSGGQNQDMMAMGKEMMQSMGGKKIADEKYQGYECEVWSLMGSKVWIYKGLTLKIESDIMGVKILKEATDIQLDIKLDDGLFQLPEYKHESIDAMMGEATEESDEEMMPEQAPTKEQLDQVAKQLQEAMKNFGGMPQQ